MKNFSDVSAYCQNVKMVADQLENVHAPVSNERLVLTLIRGLPKSFDGVAAILQQTDPLPSFHKARSMLVLEESRLAHQAASESIAAGTALLTAGSEPDTYLDEAHSSHDASRTHHRQNRGSNNRGGRNRGGGGRGRGRHNNNHSQHRGGTNGGNQQQQGYRNQQWQPWGPWAPGPQYPNPWAQQQPQWPIPPCPYPTSWPRSSGPRQQGILGPRPQQQAFSSQAPSTVNYAPTDIDAALHTLSLTPPDDGWYMNTGATSHMTSHQGPFDGDNSYAM
ncbi:uncharacterized protein LOC110689400 [Chenopodium quinoa]|uniref:uncharacterized protein LOC110689400 n=1 Tax=Chenopodium quinoa TaxID=63459 RepID=UPI000B7831A8|nr:uncharacterized protein LOC110689400 [Chenopodium quinoa]